jgi:hypothetical protein
LRHQWALPSLFGQWKVRLELGARSHARHGCKLLLDGTVIAAADAQWHSPAAQRAEQLLAEKNPNENKNSPEGLEGASRRWVMFNGGASAAQMAWMKDQLKVSRCLTGIVCIYQGVQQGLLTRPGAWQTVSMVSCASRIEASM